jgi:hypothetical protein
MPVIDDELSRLYTDIKPYFCRTRKSLIILEGIFFEIIKGLYTDPDNLQDGVKPYDPSGECPDGTYIVTGGKWSDTEAEARPAIVVDVGDLMYAPIEGFDQRTDFDLQEGVTLYTREVKGSVVFAHLAKTKGQAAQYSATTYDLVDGFSRIIRDDFDFERFDLRKVGKPTKRRDNPIDWQSLVQLDFVFYEDFSVKTESPKLKKIAVTAMTELLKENS